VEESHLQNGGKGQPNSKVPEVALAKHRKNEKVLRASRYTPTSHTDQDVPTLLFLCAASCRKQPQENKRPLQYTRKQWTTTRIMPLYPHHCAELIRSSAPKHVSQCRNSCKKVDAV
jgi:hypothetical protein